MEITMINPFSATSTRLIGVDDNALSVSSKSSFSTTCALLSLSLSYSCGSPS
jgi:hypothetical protein